MRKSLRKMSANSLTAWEIQQKELPELYLKILDIFRENAIEPLTSYQVAERLGKSNGDTKPRLTELYQKNWLKIVGKKVSEKSGMPQSLYALKPISENPNPEHLTPERKLKEIESLLRIHPKLALTELITEIINK